MEILGIFALGLVVLVVLRGLMAGQGAREPSLAAGPARELENRTARTPREKVDRALRNGAHVAVATRLLEDVDATDEDLADGLDRWQRELVRGQGFPPSMLLQMGRVIAARYRYAAFGVMEKTLTRDRHADTLDVADRLFDALLTSGLVTPGGELLFERLAQRMARAYTKEWRASGVEPVAWYRPLIDRLVETIDASPFDEELRYTPPEVGHALSPSRTETSTAVGYPGKRSRRAEKGDWEQPSTQTLVGAARAVALDVLIADLDAEFEKIEAASQAFIRRYLVPKGENARRFVEELSPRFPDLVHDAAMVFRVSAARMVAQHMGVEPRGSVEELTRLTLDVWRRESIPDDEEQLYDSLAQLLVSEYIARLQASRESAETWLEQFESAWGE